MNHFINTELKLQEIGVFSLIIGSNDNKINQNRSKFCLLSLNMS